MTDTLTGIASSTTLHFSAAGSSRATSIDWDRIAVRTPRRGAEPSIANTRVPSGSIGRNRDSARAWVQALSIPEWRIGAQVYGTAQLMILVSDADNDGIWVASDFFSDVYGDGDTPQAALNDYVRSMASELLWLLENHDSLAEASQRHLKRIQERIRRLPQQ